MLLGNLRVGFKSISRDKGTLIPLNLFVTKKSSNSAMDLVLSPPNACVVVSIPHQFAPLIVIGTPFASTLPLTD